MSGESIDRWKINIVLLMKASAMLLVVLSVSGM
jgi:hypothetical protein